jgi:hypothetical protein
MQWTTQRCFSSSTNSYRLLKRLLPSAFLYRYESGEYLWYFERNIMSSKIVLKINRIPRIRAELRPAVSAILERGAYAIERRTKENMAKPKHGRVYRRGSVMHVASAPGEPPAIDTGTLANSIRTVQLNPLRYAVQASTIYAELLYRGTSRIQPRPYLGPEAEELLPRINDEIAKIVRRAA